MRESGVSGAPHTGARAVRHISGREKVLGLNVGVRGGQL